MFVTVCQSLSVCVKVFVSMCSCECVSLCVVVSTQTHICVNMLSVCEYVYIGTHLYRYTPKKGRVW